MVSSAFPSRPFNLREKTWLVSQDVANNRSLVGWELWIDKTAYSPTWSASGIANRWLKINGSFVYDVDATGFDFRDGTNFKLASGQVYVPHNADGTKTVAIEAAANYDLLGFTSLSTSDVLPTIPRASQPSIASPTSRDLGTSITISTNRASTSFTHTLTYRFAGVDYSIATGVGASYAWTPPLSLANDIPTQTSASCVITCKTYSGSTLIGTKTLSITLKVPTSVVPTIPTVTIADQNASVVSLVGAYVQDLSVLRATVNAVGAYSSTIVASSWSMSGTTHPSGEDIPVTDSGTVTIGAAATDSRARVGSFAGSVPVLPYTPPQFVAEPTVRRSDAAGVVDLQGGTSLRVDLNATVQSLMNTTERNNLTIRVFTRPRGGSVWTARNVIAHGALTYNSNFVISGGANYPISDAFEVQVQVQDRFVTATAQIDVATAAVFMHWSNNGVGIGTYNVAGKTLNVLGDSLFEGNVTATTIDVLNTLTAATVNVSGDLSVAGKILNAGLPAPVQRGFSSTVNTITATDWGTACPGIGTISMTFDFETYVLIEMGAWLSAPSGTVRAGVSVSGATTLSPIELIPSDTGSRWGSVMHMDGAYEARSASKLVKVNAGTNVFTLEAYLPTGSGTRSVNYPQFAVIPIRAV